MTRVGKLLDRAQKALGVGSDYALAKALRWSGGQVSRYRHAKRAMELPQIVQLSDKTGIPVDEIARAVLADAAPEEKRKAA